MSIRKKVDKYFDDSQGSKMKASRELDYDGMMDDHLMQMFKPTGTKIEMGARKIEQNNDALLLDGKIYKNTKKVNRKELYEQLSSGTSSS